MSEEEAYRKFCQMRWPQTGGEPVCPRCDCLRYRVISTRACFRCKACNKQFTATSGTIFHSRKLPYSTIIRALEETLAGTNTLALAGELGVQQKSSWYLSQRIKANDGSIAL